MVKMREIDVSKIKEAVAELCIRANFELRTDVLAAIRGALKKETDSRAKGILKSIIENARLARGKRLAICQDTGITVVFLEMGQDAAIAGGDLKEAIDDGVRDGYRRGYLRKSIVDDPLFSRKNTCDNTPAVVHVDIVKGDRLKITVLPKGSGSENKSAVKMFNPTAGLGEVKAFILETVKAAGPGACPPFVVGIGIGGTFDQATLLAKKALLRPIDKRNPKRELARLEKDLVKDINALKIGPMGLGGKTTALAVKVLDAPTHITCLPVAVNINCHAARGAEKVL